MTRQFTLNELARKADLPYRRLLRKVESGELVPDSVTGRFFLFDEKRLPELLRYLNLPRETQLGSPVPETIF
jgi:hypothetical protein